MISSVVHKRWFATQTNKLKQYQTTARGHGKNEEEEEDDDNDDDNIIDDNQGTNFLIAHA